MSEISSETPGYQLGSVNIDSLKEILNQLGNSYPWQDEASKTAFHAQVSSLDVAGDPHAEAADESLSEAEAEIAELKAKLAAAEAAAQNPPANPQGQ